MDTVASRSAGTSAEWPSEKTEGKRPILPWASFFFLRESVANPPSGAMACLAETSGVIDGKNHQEHTRPQACKAPGSRADKRR